MPSVATPEFWAAYRELPRSVRRRARQAYAHFADDPSHPGLRFKRVGKRRPVYSARIGIDYRALGVMDGPVIVWFWIGPHHEYDRLLDSL
ncbi:type II toxin-antitoxin system RelE family toxin [Alienimonas chondri]|uniref:ParE-like toxin domain-containing protein n=1 Tax=Alienimonas chondri TaxID=2681879 RepID=A0ABX1VJ65_9PLAN|nr:hypothetical protein [Alienimonas chondri]